MNYYVAMRMNKVLLHAGVYNIKTIQRKGRAKEAKHKKSTF